MTQERPGRTFKDVIAEQGKSFGNAAEAFRYLTGETLSDEAAAEALWYERLRRRLVAARKSAFANQAALARAMGTSQSEVSRLENGLGPGTRFGSLRSYLTACGTSLEALMADPENDSSSANPSNKAAQAGSSSGQSRDVRLVIEGEEFLGVEAVGILESLHAVNNLLRRAEVGREARKDFILSFLYEISQVHGAPTRTRILDLDVKIDVPSPAQGARIVLQGVQVPAAAKGPTDTSFRTVTVGQFRVDVAEPLNLVDF